ncbi:MAG: hypothetical protein HS126_22035 [Anaerolineales bacterium]|nr:hypothetical protein [Anaerolineales bacterium]
MTEEAQRNLLGFDPNADKPSLDGKRPSQPVDERQPGGAYKLNARQIGQAYNLPIRVGINIPTIRRLKAGQPVRRLDVSEPAR